MKYYKLEYNSLNIKETGTQFQCVSVETIGDIQKNIFPLEGKINFEFELPIPIMESKAKQTTLLNSISIDSKFLIFKDYFLDFLTQFNISEYQTWNIRVKQKSQYYNDYKLFILNFPIQKEIVDFEESFFYNGRILDQSFVGDEIKFIDYNSYMLYHNDCQNKDDEILKFNQVTFNFNKLHTKLDMFRIYNFPFGGYYVSETLKNAIEKERYTGFSFQEIKEIDKRIKVIY